MAGTRVVLWVAIVLVAIGFLYLVRSILLPFVIAIFAALLLEPLIRRMRRRGFSRSIAVWTVFLGFFILVGAIAVALTPLIQRQVSGIQETTTKFINDTLFPPTKSERFLADDEVKKKLAKYGFPQDAQSFRKWLESTDESADHEVFFRDFSGELTAFGLPNDKERLLVEIKNSSKQGLMDRFIEKWKPTLARLGLPTTREGMERTFQIEKQVKQWAQAALGGAVTIFQYLVSSVILLIFTPIITLLFLFEYDTYKRRFVTWIPPAIRPAAMDLLGDIGEVLGGYLRGLTVSVALYMTIMAVVLTVLGVPFSLFLAIVCGIFYLIPYLGGLISAILIVFSIFAQGAKGPFWYTFPEQGTYITVVLIVFFVAHILHDQLFHPQFVGRSVGLNPVVSFFVVFSGAALFGLAGMILAFPIAGTIKVILDRLIRYTTTAVHPGELDLPRIPSRHQS